MEKPSIWNFLRDPESQRSVGNALLDAANRGMVANSLGSLVDLSTNVANLGIAGSGYIGHKTGLLSQPPELIDSRNVPGSSEWIGQKMQNAGMVSPNRNALAELGMGLLSPVAYKGAQKVGSTLYGIEQNALANLANTSTMRMQGQRGAVNIGAMSEKNLGYQGAHKPQSVKDGGAPLHDMTSALPEDFYSRQGLSYYGSGDPREAQVFRVMQQVRGKPDAMVTIYRGIPDQVDGKINPGDWVSLSPEYASDYGRIVSMKVPAKHLSANGDSLLEQGYFPE